MNFDMGKRIRELRLQKDMTQEKLASALNLTAQSISKWENGATLPDIQLLPDISAIFGVSIDELFSLSDETRFHRIDSMLIFEDAPSDADFAATEAFLREKLRDERYTGRALTQLASLYNRKAESCHCTAEHYAKRALELEPEKKDNHSLLCAAFGGEVWDWCVTNHHQQIAFYMDFMARHPAYYDGYRWLIENLLADHRLIEAGETAERMRRVRDDFHYPLYMGLIDALQGDMDAAEAHWARMVEAYPDRWNAWSMRGDAYARFGHYAKAIENYRRSIEVHKPPRFVDNYLSIAHVSEITGDWSTAADCYEEIQVILREDWKQTEGHAVERYRGLAKARREQARISGRV